jgi:hypothetical protein
VVNHFNTQKPDFSMCGFLESGEERKLTAGEKTALDKLRKDFPSIVHPTKKILSYPMITYIPLTAEAVTSITSERLRPHAERIGFNFKEVGDVHLNLKQGHLDVIFTGAQNLGLFHPHDEAHIRSVLETLRDLVKQTK